MDLFRHGLRLVGLLCAEAALVAGLHVMGSLLTLPGGKVAGWIAVTPAEDAVAAVAWLVALAGCWWLLLSTVLYAAARATRIRGLLAMVEWGTLPAVRRVADRAITVTLATSAVLAPSVARAAAEAPAPPVPVVVAEEPTVAPALPDWVPPPADMSPDDALGPTAPAGDQPASPAAAAQPAADADADGVEHVVRAGEHLWSIAEAQVTGEHHDAAETVAERDVAAYWRQVVAGNAAGLRSGDPDLIFPGERLMLPPLPAAPGAER